MPRQTTAQHGRPRVMGGRCSLPPLGGGSRGEAEGPGVPMKSWKQDGGKGPWFWVLSHGDEGQGDWR
jgi:hypothetical protein